MEHYGLVKVSRRNRRLIPMVDYQRVAVVMELSAIEKPRPSKRSLSGAPSETVMVRPSFRRTLNMS